MGKRVIVTGSIVLVAAAITAVTWMLLGRPPPRYVLRYGLTPGCEPTGQTRNVEGVTFVEIGPGCFRMGSTFGAGGDLLGRICGPLGLPWGEKPEPTDEMPVHRVEFPWGFWIAKTEVTNAQYERFDPGHKRSKFSPGDRDPVVEVTWDDAKQYCAWLAEKSGLPVRLPSESEWEAACRGGSRREFCFGDAEEDLSEYAWFDANAKGGAHEVATRSANAWGLYNLHGNVWEWCEDTYHASYEGAPSDGLGTALFISRMRSVCSSEILLRSPWRVFSCSTHRRTVGTRRLGMGIWVVLPSLRSTRTKAWCFSPRVQRQFGVPQTWNRVER